MALHGPAGQEERQIECFGKHWRTILWSHGKAPCQKGGASWEERQEEWPGMFKQMKNCGCPLRKLTTFSLPWKKRRNMILWKTKTSKNSGSYNEGWGDSDIDKAHPGKSVLCSCVLVIYVGSFFLYDEELRKSEDGNQKWAEAAFLCNLWNLGWRDLWKQNALKRPILTEFSRECWRGRIFLIIWSIIELVPVIQERRSCH